MNPGKKRTRECVALTHSLLRPVKCTGKTAQTVVERERERVNCTLNKLLRLFPLFLPVVEFLGPHTRMQGITPAHTLTMIHGKKGKESLIVEFLFLDLYQGGIKGLHALFFSMVFEPYFSWK